MVRHRRRRIDHRRSGPEPDFGLGRATMGQADDTAMGFAAHERHAEHRGCMQTLTHMPPAAGHAPAAGPSALERERAAVDPDLLYRLKQAASRG